jgi:hypothetical protein
MKSKSVVSLVGLAVIGLFFNFSPVALGDDADTATMTQAHDLLHQALGIDDTTPPSDADRTNLLNQAKALLQNAPPAHYHRHRLNAIKYIDAALFELGRSDPDHKVMDYIRSADSEVRDVE